jgi:hypothetical protein
MQDQEIRDDFAKWVGGFAPSDADEIQAYLDVSSIFGPENDELVREVLLTWLKENQQS